jgi:hypothetical protein
LESSCVLLQEDGGFVPVGVDIVELVLVMSLLLLLMRGTIMRSSSGCISDDDAASASLGLSEIHVFMAISDSLEAIELSIVSFN